MKRNEYISLEDITLMVEKGKYAGEFEIKIMETSEWFDADAWILLDNGFIDIDFELPSCIDMVEHDEFAHMCISAILEEYPEHVRGFDRFANENEFDSFEEVIEELKAVNGGSFVDTYTKYNNRVASNIKASGDAGRLTYEGISRRYKGRRINESAMSKMDSMKRGIKVVIIPNEALPFFDDRINRLSDDELLEYSFHLRGAKVYSAIDFEHLWNTSGLDYRPSDSYMRIINSGK